MATKKLVEVKMDLNCCKEDADLKLFLRKKHKTGEIILLGKGNKGAVFPILSITTLGRLLKYSIPISKRRLLNLPDGNNSYIKVIN